MTELRETATIDQSSSLMLVPSSPSVFSTITTISAVVAAAQSNASFDGEALSNMDEIISKSLLLIDFAVALVAIFFNIFVLYAVKKANSQSMLEGYRGFLLSLAFSDLLIATTTLFTPIAEFLPNTRVSSFIDRCGRTIVRSFTIAAYMSALLNLAGMSVDHYIGVFYSLRYHQIMTTRLVCITVALSWLLSIIFGFFDLFGTVAHFSVATSGNAQSTLPFGSRLVEAIADGVDGDNNSEVVSTSSNNGTVRVDKQFNKLLIDILFGPIGANENNSQTLNWEDLNSLDDNMLAGPPPPQMTTSSTMAPPIFPSPSSVQSRHANKAGIVSPKKLSGSAIPTPTKGTASGGGALLDGVTSLEEMEDILNVYATGDLNSTDIITDKFNSTGDTLFDNSLLTLQQDFNIDLQDGNRFMDWCSYYTLNKQLMEFAVVFLTVVVFTGLLMIYGRIFREVASKRDEKGLSHRTGKLVVTTVILLGAFFVCWIPFITFEAVMVLLIRTDTIRLLKAETHQQLMIVNKILNTTLILHPLLDPLIYAVRVRVVRTRLKKVYYRIVNCRNRLQSMQSSRSSSAYMESRQILHQRATVSAVSPCIFGRPTNNRRNGDRHQSCPDGKPLLLMSRNTRSAAGMTPYPTSSLLEGSHHQRMTRRVSSPAVPAARRISLCSNGPYCQNNCNTEGTNKQRLSDISDEPADSNDERYPVTYFYPGVVPNRRSASVTEEACRNVVLSLTSPLLLTESNCKESVLALAKQSSLALPRNSLKSTITMPSSALIDVDTRRSSIATLRKSLNLSFNLSNSANIPLNDDGNNNNNNNNHIINRDASLSWSSIDGEMTTELMYFNEADNNCYCYAGMCNSEGGGDGGECSSSMSICSSDFSPTLTTATAVKKANGLLTVQMNNSNELPCNFPPHHRHHKRRYIRRRPSISASYILEKVESHTRMLFAVNGCDLPLETKTAEMIDDGLQESVV